MRVSDLAKKKNMKSKELISVLNAGGMRLKSSNSNVDEAEAEKILASLNPDTAKDTAAAVPGSDITNESGSAPPKPETGAGNILKVAEGITVKEYAELVEKPATEIIKKLMMMGELLTITQSMSEEAIMLLSESLGYEAEIVSPFEEETAEEEEIPETDLEKRPPVVTVMGHVDHGKTTLLDAIRKTEVAAGEAGGITQHIGAYQVHHNGKVITFIDTPGHEAFTAMRARGAKVTDIAILVVAADDGVMPQTIEAMDHAKDAGVPIIVAVNKIDKEGANPENIRRQLSDQGLLPEAWGGETIYVDISAKQGTGIEELLEMVLLVAEMQDLKATRKPPARAVVIESRLDKGRGPLATVLVERGVMKTGDAIVVGTSYGKIRIMLNDLMEKISEAAPSAPAEVIGLSSVPEPGSEMVVVADEKTARKQAEERSLKKRLIEKIKPQRASLEDLFARAAEGELQELKIVLKVDVGGSVEAIKEALDRLDQEKVKISVIHTGVGAVTEADIMFALAANAIVVGFNVRPDSKAAELAVRELVEVRTYRVIYKLVEEIEAAMKGMLAPEFVEQSLGRAEVRNTFKISRYGTIAGCYVTDGVVNNKALVRLVREGGIVYEGKLESLRRFKDDAAEVSSGFECGIKLQDFSDIKEGDILEFYQMVVKEA